MERFTRQQNRRKDWVMLSGLVVLKLNCQEKVGDSQLYNCQEIMVPSSNSQSL